MGTLINQFCYILWENGWCHYPIPGGRRRLGGLNLEVVMISEVLRNLKKDRVNIQSSCCIGGQMTRMEESQPFSVEINGERLPWIRESGLFFGFLWLEM